MSNNPEKPFVYRVGLPARQPHVIAVENRYLVTSRFLELSVCAYRYVAPQNDAHGGRP
jgi:hypothetical protein